MQFCFMSTVLYTGTRKFLRSLLVLQIIVCGKKPRKLQKTVRASYLFIPIIHHT